MNREQWLTQLAEAMRPHFDSLGLDFGAFRVSVGFPGGRGARKATIGQCWNPKVSADGTAEVFISPVLDEPMRVADVLAHELAHAAVGTDHGHRGPFAKAAKQLGLEGKATATVAGPDFIAWAQPLVDALGPYPHASMNLEDARKKQTTRLLKVACPEDGYVVRMSRKTLDMGAPLCGVCHEPMGEVVP